MAWNAPVLKRAIITIFLTMVLEYLGRMSQTCKIHNPPRHEPRPWLQTELTEQPTGIMSISKILSKSAKQTFVVYILQKEMTYKTILFVNIFSFTGSNETYRKSEAYYSFNHYPQSDRNYNSFRAEFSPTICMHGCSLTVTY